MWAGSDRSARIPPWTTGWRVFTRPPSISGACVISATSVTAMPSAASSDADLSLATSSQPSSTNEVARSTIPVLS